MPTGEEGVSACASDTIGIGETWNAQFVTLKLIRVSIVVQAPTPTSGRIILGRILPCICMKIGHFECFWVSRGPVWSKGKRLC